MFSNGLPKSSHLIAMACVPKLTERRFSEKSLEGAREMLSARVSSREEEMKKCSNCVPHTLGILGAHERKVRLATPLASFICS